MELLSISFSAIALILFILFLKYFRKKNIQERVLLKYSKSGDKEKALYNELLPSLDQRDQLEKTIPKFGFQFKK
ncbi:hypothetical protein EC844_1372 [Acinetobacter calcoaceticus]|uniref:Uncharacterized protein n=1 Tax=Acinetobacter calcoaceticus TaxID=471 RepID=A0A4R1XBN8_ACICA|nr:hypothetical protein EC844_1372 [Acinetobacter calcoaceticus]